MKVANRVTGLKDVGSYLLLETDTVKFQIYFLDDNIIRFRSTFQEDFSEEESYALVKTAWEDQLDGVLKDERTRVVPKSVTITEEAGRYIIKAPIYTLIIAKDPFAFEIIDQDGNVVHEDLPKRAFVEDDLGRHLHYSRMGDNNYFYGFGEKSGKLNKYKRRMRMHNTDSLGWDASQSDPLYKMIPFYINLNGDNNIATGMFYNDSYDSVFDMDSEHSNYWKRYSYFETEGSDIDWFFIGGPTIKNVVEHYTDLTGKTVLPPVASLGYMGSTMYYTELDKHADDAILDFVDTCKKNGIPCDGFFLSSGYTTGEDGKRYVFNWNKDRFPNPEDFINELKKRGVLLSPNIKPGLLLTHPFMKDFEKNDAFVKTEDESEFETDQYWGGDAHFVDFTSEKGRQTWNQYMTDSLISKGITSIWNDNNEYEISNGKAIAFADGLKKPIASVKPIMSTMMAKSSHDAMKKYNPDIRPYVTNRAGFAGIQRYAQTWAGDNGTNWTNLKYNVPTILGMGLSGVANQGCDIGGFDGPAPEPELFVRWVQNGVFQPRFSIHSSNTDNTVTEPWMYPDYTKYIRDAIKLRYSLIPYFYSLLFESSTKGSPIMRPLVYEFQDDQETYEESFEFMLGSSLLVSNVLDKGEKEHKVYLPKGTEWVDLSNNTYYEGGQIITIPVDISSIPMFLKSGSIVPMTDNLNNIHNDTITKMKFLIEPSTKASFDLYEDDGKSNDYKDGQCLKSNIRVSSTDNGVEVVRHSIGEYSSLVEDIEYQIYCPTVAPAQVLLNSDVIDQYLNFEKFQNAKTGWFFDGQSRKVIVKVPNTKKSESMLDVSFAVKDLISL
ncbi:TIM-barrel domain-containing protein [Lentilactobacillus sp. Marseille-Q4993]|uniref:glycoside hydrolase family 31 protein n=1 Tax=Lentilactobacillus sp. Marseille-Q4993 TaxID=3039492 RepID=UPI0024BCBF44|nr:TIM-barrel domain-containing protein [Lentilactobacillus sp. Marseille-Q4993]